MADRLLSRNVLGSLGLTFGVFLSACAPSFSVEDAPTLGTVLQETQGGSLDGGLGPSVATGSTCGKTSDSAPSCAPPTDAPDVVYSWTAPASDRYTFTTAGSDFDTVLELKSASSSAHVLACNDDDLVSYALQASLEVDLVIGQQVLVAVDSYGMNCGNYTLGISAQCGGCDTPPGSCHQPAGTCVNGACVYSLRPAGSACNDGNACTIGDTCNSSGVCAGTPGGCSSIIRPVDTNGDSLVTICLSGLDHGDCDYSVLDGLTVRMPLKGSVTFPYQIIRILSGPATYAKLVERSGGTRQMTFHAPFEYILKINPDNPRQLFWEVPESHGVFVGTLFGHHEVVDLAISIGAELSRPTGPIRITAKITAPNQLRLSY